MFPAQIPLADISVDVMTSQGHNGSSQPALQSFSQEEWFKNSSAALS